jgi:DNA primase small subunit
VCIPIDPSKVDSFDPMAVPTLKQLTDEIDAFAREEADKKVTKEYKKTSLKEPVRIFEEFLSGLEESRRGRQMDASDAKMDF